MVFPYIALIFSIMILLFATWYSFAKRRVYVALLGTLAMYGVFTLINLSNLTKEFPLENVSTAAYVYFVGAFCLVSSIFTWEIMVPSREVSNSISSPALADESLAQHVNWATVAGLASLYLFLVEQENFGLSWNETRLNGGYIVVVATFLLMLSSPGIVSGILIRRKFQALLLLFVNLVSFMMSGSRAVMIGALAYAAWISFFRVSRKYKLLAFTCLGCLSLVAHIVLRMMRGMSLGSFIVRLREGDLFTAFRSNPAIEDVSGGEFAITKYLIIAVQASSVEIYGFMTSVLRLALLFVPRSLMESKPLDVTYQLWCHAFLTGAFEGMEGYDSLEEAFSTGDYGSLHATLFGEFFLSGGWPSLVVSSIIIGAVCVFINRYIHLLSNTLALFVLGPTLVGMLMVGRGNSVIGFGYFFYLTTFLVILETSLKQFAQKIKYYNKKGGI